MAHAFLSDEWIAAARDVRALHADDEREVNVEITMNQIITHVPFGAGTIESYLDTSTGTMILELGQLENADVTITTDYETAKTIFIDRNFEQAMQAFMSGKIRVQGDLMKLMTLQAAIPDDEQGRAVAADIQAITA